MAMLHKVSLASIGAPLAFSSFYLAVRDAWPGAIWLSVVAVYAIGAALVFGLPLDRSTRPAPGQA